MIYKETWLSASDNTNVRWLKTFQLYKGFRRKVTKTGFFIKGSAKIVEPPRTEYKGFKFKFNKKGDICRGLIVRTKYKTSKYDSSFTIFYNNSIILLKKKYDVKSKYIYGPISTELRRKKFLNLFKVIV